MGSGYITPLFMTSAEIGGGWSASRYRRVTPGNKASVTPETVWAPE
jgi:hypothetical protein